MSNKMHLKPTFLKNLQESKGIVSYACQQTGISRYTYYEWLKSDAKFKKLALEITEYVIDLVEAKLLSNINEGDTTAIIFFLKTKGRKRGYVERQELHVKQVDKFELMTEEELTSKIETLRNTLEIDEQTTIDTRGEDVTHSKEETE